MKKESRTIRNSVQYSIAAALAVGIGALCSADLPQGYKDVDGIEVIPNDNVMSIISDLQNGILQWDSFSIGKHNEVIFHLNAGDQARLINLVVESNPSDIYGKIYSQNGSVFLVNPAGVTFHDGSYVNAAEFIAAAGSMSQEAQQAFLDGGHPVFQLSDRLGGDVRVESGATLEARVLHLIGQRVVNEGMLKSNGKHGIVGMFAGNGEIMLGEENGRVFVKIDGTKMDGSASPGAFSHNPDGGIGVDNQGTIHTGKGGRAFLGAGDMYSLAVRNTGTIHAHKGEVNIAGKGDVRNAGAIVADIATFGGRDIQLDSDMTDVENLLEFHDPVTLQRNLTLQAGDIIANSTIDGLQDGLQNLMLFGNVQLLDDVGAKNRLGALTVDGSLFIGGSEIATLGQQLYLADITVGENATLRTDSQVAFFAPVEALSAGSHGLTIDGRLLVNDRIGENSPLKHLLANRQTTINTDWVRTIGDQQYRGAVILATTSKLEAIDGESQVWFYLPLDALAFGDQDLTITGNARFDGRVGAGKGRELASLDVTGNSLINTDLIRTAGHQTYGGDVTLGGLMLASDGTMPGMLVTLDGTDIWFQSMVNAKQHGLQGLHVLGNATFDGNVGTGHALSRLLVDQDAAIRGVLIQTVGNQEYGTDGNETTVLIDGDSVLRALNSTFIFNSSIDDVAEGHSSLLLDGNTQFHGLVGQNHALHSIEVLGTTQIDTSAITTTNLQSYAQAVELTENATLTSHIMDFGSTIDGGHELMLNIGDTLRLGGDVGAERRLILLEINAGGVTTIEGEQILTLGDILFNPDGTEDIPDIATFAGMNDLLIDSANGSFFMGQHQKLSVLGNLLINTHSGTATLSDLNSLGNMTVNASAIFLQSRMPDEILRFDGSRAADFGVDFVAGGDISFSTTPELLRPGFALFASSTGAIDLGGNANQFFLISADPVTRDMFFFGDIVLDLTALDTLPDNLAEVLEGADLELEDTVLPDPLRLILLETLQNMNLNVRDLSAQEYAERLAGRDLYDDSANMVIDDPAQKQIAVNRLRRQSVMTVVDTYIDLFLEADRDPDSGELTNVVDRRSHVRESFETAWRDYHRRSLEPTPDGFLQYIRNNPAHEQLTMYITGIEHMFRELSIMGLTQVEYESASSAVLEPILPDGLGWREMYTAINRRG